MFGYGTDISNHDEPDFGMDTEIQKCNIETPTSEL